MWLVAISCCLPVWQEISTFSFHCLPDLGCGKLFSFFFLSLTQPIADKIHGFYVYPFDKKIALDSN